MPRREFEGRFGRQRRWRCACPGFERRFRFSGLPGNPDSSYQSKFSLLCDFHDSPHFPQQPSRNKPARSLSSATSLHQLHLQEATRWRNHIRRCPRHRPRCRKFPICSKCSRCNRCNRCRPCRLCLRSPKWPSARRTPHLNIPLRPPAPRSPDMRCPRTSGRAPRLPLRLLLNPHTSLRHTPRARRFLLPLQHPQAHPTIRTSRHLRQFSNTTPRI